MDSGIEKKDWALIQAVFKRVPEVEQVLLYGSRAKGNYRLGSDIDLTMKGQGLTHAMLLSLAFWLDELLLPYTFDLSIYQTIDNPALIAHIDRVGAEVYHS